MEARELYWELIDEVVDKEFVFCYPDYSQAVQRAHEVADGDDFEGDFYQLTAFVVKQARDAYLESIQGEELASWMQDFRDWEVWV